MTDIKKKHHFVPQFYLKNWANEKKQVFILRNNKIFPSSISDALQENRFYELDSSFSKSQNELFKILLNIKNPNKSLQSAINLTSLILNTHNEMELIKKLYKVLNIEITDNDLLSFKSNILEDYFSSVETKISSVLEEILSENWEKLTWKSYDILTQFIAFQLCRTRKTRDNVVKQIYTIKSTIETKLNSSISTEEIEGVEKLYLAIIVPTILNNCFLFNNMIFHIIKNETSLNYITSDQPVFNLFGSDDKKYMRFSVPLSPKILLTCDIFPMEEKMKNYIHEEFEEDRRIMELQLDKIESTQKNEALKDTGKTIFNKLIFHKTSSNEIEIKEQNNLINQHKNTTLIAYSKDDLLPYKK